MDYKDYFGVTESGKVDWNAVCVYVVGVLLIIDVTLNVFRV